MPETANPATTAATQSSSGAPPAKPAKAPPRSSPKATAKLAEPKQAEPSQEPAPPPGTGDLGDLNALFAMNTRALQAFHQSNEALLSAFASFADEMLKFTQQGLQLSDQWTQSMASFQDQTKDRVGTGFDYARVATEEYFRSTQKLLALSQAISGEVWRRADAEFGEKDETRETR